MKTVTIITPSNTEVEYQLAGAGSRAGAFVIDFTIQMILVFGVLLALDFVMEARGSIDFDNMAIAVLLVSIFLIHFGYFIVCEMFMNGQSIGKRILGLRVIRDNGQPIEFWHSLLRGLLRASLDMIYIGIFVIMRSAKNKRIGDMVAGTIVVIEHYSNKYESSLFSITSVDFPAYLPPAEDMTPTERQLVEEWIRRKHNFLDDGAELARLFVDYFNKKKEKQEANETIETNKLLEKNQQENYGI